MISLKNHKSGFSLIELVVTIGIFSLLSAMMYSTFNAVQKQVTKVSADSSLSDKGQRILAFMEEDIRMIGFLLGPDARIPYCSAGVVPTNSNVIVYAAGTGAGVAYDTFQFFTSLPIMLNESPASCMTGQTDSAGVARKDYFLTTRGETLAGTTSISVDATLAQQPSATSCSNDIDFGSSQNVNGRSLITFDSIQLSAAAVAGSASQLYYTLNMPGSTVSTYEPLQQNVPDNSTVYAVRQYTYRVGSRNLQRIGRDASCGLITTNLIETSNTAGAGGVDGLKFEFTFIDTITNQLITQATPDSFPLTQLKSITIWLLLRSDKIDQDYSDTATYVLGSTTDKVTLGPYNDPYRRRLLSKTVEVKNLASIN